LVDLESTSSTTSGGRKIRKRFCSERCFGLHRRAMFKKSKRCEWCHAGLSDSDVSFGTSGLHFCSDSCRARFLAERNTKPVNVAKAPPAVAQSSSPPLSSENVQIHSGILNPQCYQTSPASMEQALWLSRATALLRVEEERRKHEHLKQTLLKYAPQYAASGRNSKLPNLRAAAGTSSSASTSIQTPNVQETNKDSKSILHPLKRRRLSNGRAEAQMQPQKPVTSASKPPPPLILGPRQSDSRSSEVNTRLTNTLVPPPTLLMPMPCFVPIPFPIPLLIPVPYDKFYKNEVSASNSGSEETMEDNTSGEENEQNRQRRRSLIMDKPLRNAER